MSLRYIGTYREARPVEVRKTGVDLTSFAGHLVAGQCGTEFVGVQKVYGRNRDTKVHGGLSRLPIMFVHIRVYIP
jgi:hypothetical protein